MEIVRAEVKSIWKLTKLTTMPMIHLTALATRSHIKHSSSIIQVHLDPKEEGINKEQIV